MMLRFAYFHLFYVLIPVFILALLYRLKFYKSPRYTFPLAHLLAHHGSVVTMVYHKNILFLIRAAGLIALLMMIARPQWLDEKSQVNVKGVDIVIALDVSNSMMIFDDLKDRRSRISVAKDEAIRFIEKRHNDPIGLVIFARDAVSRSPLTLDKMFLKELVGSLELGIIDPIGTSLGTGLATAVNRLKKSEAKSKVIILLTDGEPTSPEKVEPDIAIDLAKQYGVKVYTIGVGGEKGGFIVDPRFGIQQVNVKLNIELLQRIARETGGQFFKADKPQDMRIIYDKIDILEKTDYKTNLFQHYYEAFLHFIWIVLLLFAVEFLLRFFLWRGV
jgi:Ca-activated chloride channel family protein